MVSTNQVNEIIKTISKDPLSRESFDLRKEIFVRKQTIGNMRKWFDILPTIKLTTYELDIVKSVVVKPKSTEVFIINYIIKFQDLTNDDMDRWISFVPTHSLTTIAMSVILKPSYDNLKIKLMLLEKLLKHINYIDHVFVNLAIKLPHDTTGFWQEAFNLIISLIKKEDSLAEKISNSWVESSNVGYFDLYASHRDIESRLLYEKTGKLQYLSKTTQEIFIF